MVPMTVDDGRDGRFHVEVGTMERPRSKMATFYRSVLFQMILFGMLSLVGPAMSDAITNLGGGGLSTPWLANLGQSLSYTMSFFSTILGGPIINKIGVKWASLIAAVAMPLHGSAYYVNARYKNNAYLLSASLIKGFASGFLYVAETTAMLSYPHPEERGFYLGIWSAMRNSGSVIGGAINFSNNHKDSDAGGVAWSTYLIFVGLECTGLVWALLLSRTTKVRRRDNSKVNIAPAESWMKELRALATYLQQGTTWLIFVPAFYSFFYGGTMGTYLSLHFSVRARALSSFLVPTLTIPTVILFGKLLDTTRWTQRTRAWTAMAVWGILQAACFIWVAVEYHTLPKKTALDYRLQPAGWIRAYFPYIMLFISGYWTQLTLYWILSTLSDEVAVASRAGGVFRAFEVAGQAVSYGLSSAKKIDHAIPLYVNIAILVFTIPSMSMLIRKMPKRPVREAIIEDDGKDDDLVFDGWAKPN
ncbi:hypothetical protein BM1_01424 [Bipolaris maydis]|nr:hypothetical protein BM1_01424 [Bipolaris maydis]